MTTRRQHYVWRNYLQPWAQNDKIWCQRNGKIFNTGLMNIGQERDFYATNIISQEEVDYILESSKHRHKGDLISVNKEFISFYKLVSDLKSQPDRTAEISALLIEFEEGIMGVIEQQGSAYLPLLQRGDASFFEANEHRAGFAHFLMIQFVRTKRMRDTVVNAMRAPLARHGLNIENIWPVEKYVDARHMALSVYASKEYKISFMRNSTPTELITSDQPVFNIHAIGASGQIPAEVELYYPVTPALAIMLSKKSHEKTLTENDVRELNSWVREMSHEQIYSASQDFL
ncbi:hypothetical protein PS900_01901 [Pseudomonas fluorescens]|uniref:DUF4238 domain-containing protein n=1 Tax=Pseudomonas fluorescens TaxID=294 RepID=A0A8H2RQ81_PSEFL|nr:DUF4238 domain-containing protein [Pseudomonas fluorescens]VVO82685.1 hypothetical protein PS900_01901 [Pseudomonas fluorescens]